MVPVRRRERQHVRQQRRLTLRDTLWGAGAAAVIAVLLQVFVVQVFSIPSASMEGTLMVGDRVAVNKLAHLDRGDVVVFRDTEGWLGATGDYLVKRVIGLPGDHVQAAAGILTVNGTALYEPYVPAGMSASTVDFDVTVPAHRLWVMGDNRDDSADSRFHMQDDQHGFVPVEDVRGDVFAVIWPVTDAHLIDPVPESFRGIPDTEPLPHA